MSVKTLRLNKQEEKELKALLKHTGQDFSHCMKELIRERLEDLADLNFIERVKEAGRKVYVSAEEIDSVAHRRITSPKKHLPRKYLNAA